MGTVFRLPASTPTSAQLLDRCRKAPLGFCELGNGGMSELAALCRQWRLGDLFMTAMKKYGGGGASGGGDGDAGAGAEEQG
jgi:hypothetical protein